MTIDLSKLNPEQKIAVTHENGPLLIIAGAGTGKTHVITTRILYLLLEKNVPYSSILALTFTEKATEEMIERIDQSLPYSYEELAIHTFHSFCDKILRENGLEIGLDTSYSILTQLDQWMFIKKNLFKFELDYYRPLGNPNKFISALVTHFSRLKDEDISPEDYAKFAETLPEDDEDEQTEKKRILEVSNTYKKYQELKIENNVLDFNDLHYFTLRLFEKRPHILKNYQEKFQHILIDEFQDTNYAQSKLIKMLADHHKNITVVGDDDQSIYRWRGASMNTILQFKENFPKYDEIVLKTNYRSVPDVLNASYDVIQNNNPDRIDKKLEAHLPQGEKAEIHHFSHHLYETRFVANKIQELIRESSGEMSYKDFAILVRSHKLANSYIDEMKSRDIPFQVRNPESLFKLVEIKDLVGLLRFLSNPRDDIALFRVLSYEFFDLPMRVIVNLLHKAKRKHTPLFKILFEEISDDQLEGIDEDNTTLKKLVNLLNELIEFSKNNNVSKVVSEFLNKSKYLHYLQENQSVENEEKIVNIAEFLRIIKEFESEHNEQSIYTFLDFLKLLEDAGARLDRTLSEVDQDAVQILTVHAAKGLEYPVVFIPSAVQQRFPSTSRKDPIAIPDALLKESLPDKDMHLQEERRLFYVACTRAKNRLFVLHSDKYEGTRKWKPSVFVEEMKKSESAQVYDHDEEVPETHIEEPKKEALTSAPTRSAINRLSYSQLDTFKTCPLKYQFRYLYQIPSPDSHAANFGSSVHNALNEFYQKLKNGETPSFELLMELYEKNWIPYGYESKAHENARKKKGIEMLEAFYKTNSNPWVIPYSMEKPFNIKIDSYTINGRIDRIDKLEDGTYEIIDYKTGNLKKGANLKKDMQLSIYGLAARDVFKIPVSKLSLYFLGDNEKVSASRSEEELKKAIEEIKENADAMQTSNFDAKPGFPCSFCEYKLICNKAQC